MLTLTPTKELTPRLEVDIDTSLHESHIASPAGKPYHLNPLDVPDHSSALHALQIKDILLTHPSHSLPSLLSHKMGQLWRNILTDQMILELEFHAFLEQLLLDRLNITDHRLLRNYRPINGLYDLVEVGLT